MKFFNLVAIIGLLFIVLANVFMIFDDISHISLVENERSEYVPGMPQPAYLLPAYIWGAVFFWILGCVLNLIGGSRSKQRFFRLPLIVLGILLSFETMLIPVTYFWSPYSQPPYGNGITVSDIATIPLWAIPGLVVVAEGLLLFGGRKKAELK